MDDGGHRTLKTNHKSHFLDGLKNEWKLFWETLGHSWEDEEAPEAEATPEQHLFEKKLQLLSPDQLKALGKALSLDRKRINQRIEKLNRELELSTLKLQSAKLVGGDFEKLEQNINELSDLGVALSLQLQNLDERLKMMREREQELKDQLSNP
jgi:DNA repair exonuclease SbcCD ATPase subunit